MSRKDNKFDWKMLLLIFVYSAVVTFVLAVMSGCRTEYITVPEYHEVHDTVISKEYVDREVIKEVTVRDSVSFLVKGDTVRIERFRYERDYRYEKELQAKIDSLSQIKRDSVPYPVPGPVEYVPAQMTNMQIFYMTLGKVFLFMLFLALIVILVKRRFFGIFKS